MNAMEIDFCLFVLVAYGSWFNHVKSWWKKKEEHPILFLHYEDMKEVKWQKIILNNSSLHSGIKGLI